ncbi:MAG: hypothetical protein JG764_973 [Clostridiales bacterium]|jgi:hypothetical protein|nr:hypothetical protein [Clostridiales bacterium]
MAHSVFKLFGGSNFSINAVVTFYAPKCLYNNVLRDIFSLRVVIIKVRIILSVKCYYRFKVISFIYPDIQGLCVTGYYYCPGGSILNKRFPLVLDEECMKILSGIPSKKKAEYVRNAIKHYSECKSLEKQTERLKNLVDKLESNSSPPVESNTIFGSKEESEKEKDYILDGFLSDIENLE